MNVGFATVTNKGIDLRVTRGRRVDHSLQDRCERRAGSLLGGLVPYDAPIDVNLLGSTLKITVARI